MPVVQHSLWYTVTSSWSRAIVIPADAARPRTRSLRLHGDLRLLVLWAVIAALGFGGAAAWAEPDKTDDDTKVVSREMMGTVSAVGSSYLTLVYNKDAEHGVDQEILLNIGKDVEMLHLKKLTDLTFGDTVRVKFDERQRTVHKPAEDGTLVEETQVVGREITLVSFLKPANTGFVSKP